MRKPQAGSPKPQPFGQRVLLGALFAVCASLPTWGTHAAAEIAAGRAPEHGVAKAPAQATDITGEEGTQTGLASNSASHAARLVFENASASLAHRMRLSADVARDVSERLAVLLRNGRLPERTLARLIGNPVLAARVEHILRDLGEIDPLPGVDGLALRMSRSSSLGEAYEAHVAARMKDQIAQVGPVLEGQEVDLVLKDGTLVEIKLRRLEKLRQQLPRYDALARNSGRVMVVTSEEPGAFDRKTVRHAMRTMNADVELAVLPFAPGVHALRPVLTSREVRAQSMSRQVRAGPTLRAVRSEPTSREVGPDVTTLRDVRPALRGKAALHAPTRPAGAVPLRPPLWHRSDAARATSYPAIRKNP